jgi:hypothetical protein
MSNPPETRALKQLVWVGLIAIAIGFLGTFALLEWLIIRFVVPEGHWFEILHCCITAILFSIIGGLGFGALSVRVLDWYHYKRGSYRCRFCERPLKGAKIVCSCAEAQAWRKRALELRD